MTQEQDISTKRLHEPAPRREWRVTAYEGTTPLFSSCAWTDGGIANALDGGAFFQPGCHDFADKEAEQLAFKRTPLPCSDS